MRSEVKGARREGRKTLIYVCATAILSNFAVDAAKDLAEWVKVLCTTAWAHLHLTLRIWWD